MVTPTSNPDLSSPPLSGRVNDDSGISHPQKRTHLQFSQPCDETARVPQGAWDPRKKVKTTFTTASVRRASELEDLRSLRTLQLARTSRCVIAAELKYRRLRVQEIEAIRSIAIDECKEVEARLQRADLELGEISLLRADGTPLENSGVKLFGEGHDSDADSDSESSQETDYKSPTPSDDKGSPTELGDEQHGL